MSAPLPADDPGRVLARLAGPPGMELSCEECFEQLDLYVELELARSGADAAIPGMQAHLQGCSACAEDHESLRALLLSEAGKTSRGRDAHRNMHSTPSAAAGNGARRATTPSFT